MLDRLPPDALSQVGCHLSEPKDVARFWLITKAVWVERTGEEPTFRGTYFQVPVPDCGFGVQMIFGRLDCSMRLSGVSGLSWSTGWQSAATCRCFRKRTAATGRGVRPVVQSKNGKKKRWLG